jgi:addiction module RelE/StbE family toxin
MVISYTKAFLRQAKRLSPELKYQLQERLAQFSSNPLTPALHNHALRGKYKNYRSINVTGDVRALYMQRDDEAIFDAVGTHSQLYG